MRATSTRLVCPVCKALVDVVDKTVADHSDCPMSGMRHVPSQSYKAGPGAPKVEMLGLKPFHNMPCSGCGNEHSGISALMKVTPGNPTLN